MSGHPITLTARIVEAERRNAQTAHGLTELMIQIGWAAKRLGAEIGRAVFSGEQGTTGRENPTGDRQKKLDVFANDLFTAALADTGVVAGIVSEEMRDIQRLSAADGYIVCMDPLDGSSNTDINGALGTVFGLYAGRTPRTGDLAGQLIGAPARPVAAGYIMFGTSTVLVFTSGQTVDGFTLDRDTGEFLLSHPAIRCPTRGQTYSANLARRREWAPELQRYVDRLDGSGYSLRYSGAMVADLHRILLEGGVYLYPAGGSHPAGKLRLLYECAPLALIAERAGGRASTGTGRVLDVRVDALHQHVPLIIGSADDVAQCEGLAADRAA